MTLYDNYLSRSGCEAADSDPVLRRAAGVQCPGWMTQWGSMQSAENRDIQRDRDIAAFLWE